MECPTSQDYCKDLDNTGEAPVTVLVDVHRTVAIAK